MRVKASTILKACYNREYEKRFAQRYAQAGYPPIEVVWDVPKTAENMRLIEDFIRDYYHGAKTIRLFNPKTRRYYLVRLRSSTKRHDTTILGSWKPPIRKPACFGDFPEEPDAAGNYPPWLCQNCAWRRECEKKTFAEEVSEP